MQAVSGLGAMHHGIAISIVGLLMSFCSWGQSALGANQLLLFILGLFQHISYYSMVASKPA